MKKVLLVVLLVCTSFGQANDFRWSKWGQTPNQCHQSEKARLVENMLEYQHMLIYKGEFMRCPVNILYSFRGGYLSAGRIIAWEDAFDSKDELHALYFSWSDSLKIHYGKPDSIRYVWKKGRRPADGVYKLHHLSNGDLVMRTVWLKKGRKIALRLHQDSAYGVLSCSIGYEQVKSLTGSGI